MTLRQEREQVVSVIVRTFERMTAMYRRKLHRQLLDAGVWSDALSTEFCYEQLRAWHYACSIRVLSERIIDEYISRCEAFNQVVLDTVRAEKMPESELRHLELQLSRHTVVMLLWLDKKRALLTELDARIVLHEHDYDPAVAPERAA